MNFANLTDFQINWRVLEIKSGKKPLNYPHNADGRSVGIRDVNDNYHWYDFCNDWADSGPIIAANKISLDFDADGYEPPQNVWCRASSPCGKIYYGSENEPLRAAMIVFLMTQEKENG